MSHHRKFFHLKPCSIRRKNIFGDETPQVELIRLKYRLGYYFLMKVLILFSLVILTQHLITAWTPKCEGCMYGVMDRRSWWNKHTNNHVILCQLMASGKCVLVEFNISTQVQAHQSVLSCSYHICWWLQWSCICFLQKKLASNRMVKANM